MAAGRPRERPRPGRRRSRPTGVRDFLNGISAPFPDLASTVVEKTVQDDRAAFRWEATGTFAGATFQGVEPNGARLDLEGTDVLIVARRADRRQQRLRRRR